MIVLDWLKKLFVRNEPVETTKEENTLYEIHCHQCDNVFMSGGLLLQGICGDFLKSWILSFTKISVQ